MNTTSVSIAVFAAVFVFAMLLAVALADVLSRGKRRVRARLRSIDTGINPAAMPDFVLLRDQSYSHIPFVDRVLSALSLTEHLRARIQQAGLSINAGTLILASLCVAGIAWVLVSLFTPLIMLRLAAAVGALFIPYLVVLHKRTKRLERFDELLPEAVDMVVNSLRAGFALEASLSMVAQEMPDPLGPEFGTVFEEQNLGVDLMEALGNLCARLPSHDLKMLVTAVGIQKRTGGNLAEVLAKIAAMVRERFSLRREIRIYTAQGRLSGVILAILPLVVLLILSVLMPALPSMLLHDPQGRILLIVALALQVVGFMVIRRITDVEI